MVRSGWFGCCFWLGGGGCGTSASSPLGVSGVMTMKMISSTSSTSISGVTFMSAVGPPPAPPTAIPIVVLLLPGGRDGRRGRGCAGILALFGQQAQIIYAGCTHIIHYLHHRAVLGAGIGADKNALVNAVGQTVLHLLRQRVGRDHVVAEIDLA